MAESPCSGQSGEALKKAETAAIEMYRFAALMLGDEAEALRLVEDTVATVEIDPCTDPRAAKGLVRERVLATIVRLLGSGIPGNQAWDTGFNRLRVGWERALARLKLHCEKESPP